MAKPNGATSLDQALDELYRASPAEFTESRDALAKRLKEAGDAAASAEVKRRRKPTQLAYVLNQLARRHGDDVADLVDVGRELARAQRKALRGEAGGELRDAIARQRTVVGGLTTKAATLMGELGVPVAGHLDEIASALRAALVDPLVGAQLEEGRLEKVPEPAAGFPGAAPEAVVGGADAGAAAEAEAEEHAKAKAKAKGKADARTKAKERADEERREAERARRAEAARAAGAEAKERARVADDAERIADGDAAQAKKLDDEARALAAEARRLAGEAKRVGHEADVARRKADRAATEAARSAKRAKLARSVADRAAKHAQTSV